MFHALSPYEGDGLRNHCLRLFTFADMLLSREGCPMDRDLAYAVAMVHDLGLVTEQDEGRNYMQRSAALFRRLLGPQWRGDASALEVADQCLLYNHRLLPGKWVHPEVECFRRAVWVEHSLGKKRYGLDREVVEQVFALYPRDNFDRVLRDFSRRVLLREPLTVVRGIFF